MVSPVEASRVPAERQLAREEEDHDRRRDASRPAEARAAEAELQRLRHEVVQLRAERDFLKKAAAYFAKDAK
mgnify:CR=1 FL=1